MACPALVFKLRQAELVRNLFEQRQFALITTEFMFLVAEGVSMARSPRVLQIGSQRRVGQARAAIELVIFQLRQHSKTLSIALEIQKVTALGLAHAVQPAAPGRLLKPMADGVFAGMAKRRVADVVSQAGRLHHHAQVGGVAPVWQRVAQGFTDTHAQRAADAADFQRVGQAGVNVIVAGDRVHLGLAPEAAECAGENDAVMVFVKRAAAEFLRAVQRLAETFAVEQGRPIQGWFSPSGD
jgi:uncharacterized protein YoaH (UPF0181 family)